MPNYWLGIMAVVLAITLAVWIGLVFRADKHQAGQPRAAAPKREVIGGMFAARQGGRQVMPDPEEPIVHDGWSDQHGAPTVPGPRTEPVTEQTPARGDRR